MVVSLHSSPLEDARCTASLLRELLIERNFKRVHIIIGDYLYRFNYCAFSTSVRTMKKAWRLAQKKGDELADCIGTVLPMFPEGSVVIHRWREVTESFGCRWVLSVLQAEYGDGSTPLRAFTDEALLQYYRRRKHDPHAEISDDKKVHLVNFALGELAWLLQDDGAAVYGSASGVRYIYPTYSGDLGMLEFPALLTTEEYSVLRTRLGSYIPIGVVSAVPVVLDPAIGATCKGTTSV